MHVARCHYYSSCIFIMKLVSDWTRVAHTLQTCRKVWNFRLLPSGLNDSFWSIYFNGCVWEISHQSPSCKLVLASEPGKWTDVFSRHRARSANSALEVRLRAVAGFEHPANFRIEDAKTFTFYMRINGNARDYMAICTAIYCHVLRVRILSVISVTHFSGGW